MTQRGTDVSEMTRKYRTANAGDFPDGLSIDLVKESELRYGENPNQPAAVYCAAGSTIPGLTNVRLAKSGKGGLSATNLMDVCRALNVLKFFPDQPSVAVMKHAIPSGFATGHGSLTERYVSARDADARSAFGSIVVFNRPVDVEAAKELLSTYVEGVAAPEYESGAMEVLEGKKDLRAMLYSHLDKVPRFIGDDTQGIWDLKALPTGRVIIQAPYLTSIRGSQDVVTDPMVYTKPLGTLSPVRHVVNRDPTPQEFSDLLTAWYLNIGVRSNGIVIVKDGVTLAVGSGQQERVGAVEQAIVKSYQKAMDRQKMVYDPLNGAAGWVALSPNPLQGAVMSSDAFFPFADSIKLAARVGISAIIQPGGSKNDHEVIDEVNNNDMAMAFTLERCFGHF